MTLDLRFRLATADDHELLRVFARRLTAFDLPEWRTADEIANADAKGMIASVARGSADDEVLLAEAAADEGVVGCLHMLALTDFFGKRHGHISVIATREGSDGRGIGSALMAHAEQWTKARGLTVLTLNVFDGNQRARRKCRRGSR